MLIIHITSSARTRGWDGLFSQLRVHRIESYSFVNWEYSFVNWEGPLATRYLHGC